MGSYIADKRDLLQHSPSLPFLFLALCVPFSSRLEAWPALVSGVSQFALDAEWRAQRIVPYGFMLPEWS